MLAPRVQEPVDFNKATPVWSFAALDLDGPFGWRSLVEPDDQVEVLNRLRALEKMTWHEIKMEGKKRNHSIRVADCSKEAQKRLRELELDDVDELFSLGVKGEPRIIGILDRTIFKILWWDPEHQVCPSHKKHT